VAEDNRTDKDQPDEYLEELRNDHLGLVGSSSAMVALRDLIRRVAQSPRPVLISGPSGSGKSLVADAIHRLGTWGPKGSEAGALVRVSCLETGEHDLERVLFGTESHPGLLAAAGGVTLVLDDVNGLSECLQAKMVRLLQTGAFRPVGSAVERRVSIRVLAVTNRSLARCVRENTFRADLLYELGVLTVPVPGLDEHRDDIPALVNHFLRLAKSNLRLSGDALDVLAGRSWPGSVRELRNLVERSIIQARDQVIGRDVMQSLIAPEPMETIIDESLQSLAARLLGLPIGNKLAAVEAALLECAMRLSGGNKSGAARLLGLHRKAVERKLEKYSVVAPIQASTAAAASRLHKAQPPASSSAETPVREREVGVRRNLGPLHLQG
jgi:DNA-binding NtrC family response regulator